VRYVKQPRDTYICGPVAVINALKWAGSNTTLKDLKKVKNVCEYNLGVKSGDVSRALRKLGRPYLKFICRRYATIDKIDEHLDKGGFIILLTSVRKPDGKRRGHYWAISYKHDDLYKAHNVEDRDGSLVHSYISRNRVLELMQNSIRKHGDPRVWLVRRVKGAKYRMYQHRNGR